MVLSVIAALLVASFQSAGAFAPVASFGRPTPILGPAASTVESSITESDARVVNGQKTVVISGATGYIGRAVVAESVKRGYNTVALVRNMTRLQTSQGVRDYGESFAGATVLEADVEDPRSLEAIFQSIKTPIDTVVSCLASPTGTKKEAYAIDYQATLNCLEAGQNVDARHFILLSAFCCRRPLLQLQQAKLKFEAELAAQDKMTWSVVRPTAYFKSISGQLEAIQGGAPYVLFDDGEVTRCNAIAESELAEYMLNCMTDEEKKNRILNIGGPDEPLTNKMLGDMMFKAIGKEPKYVYAPTWIFDSVIQTFQFFATLFKSEALEEAAETGRIGKYYAVEDMLTTDPAEKYGKITTMDYYDMIAAKGQDPFAPVRATAVIGRVLESLPSLGLALTTVFAFSTPKIVAATAQAEMKNIDFSLLMASLRIH